MPAIETPYKHFSSMTLMTDRIPFECSFGVGAAASDPSPRKSVWSSHFANCAASLMVNGRTRTVTEMDDAPSAAMVVHCGGCNSVLLVTSRLRQSRVQERVVSERRRWWLRNNLRRAELAERVSESSNVYAAHGPHKHWDLKLATTPNLGRRQRMRPTHRIDNFVNQYYGCLFRCCGCETCATLPCPLCYSFVLLTRITRGELAAMLGHP